MTHTQQFIQDAIEGGSEFIPNMGKREVHFVSKDVVVMSAFLLEPKNWQAVGKKRGWGDNHDSGYTNDETGEHECYNCYPIWIEAWHTFINHLTDGKSIEDALAAISE